jgi:hypothetical protein
VTTLHLADICLCVYHSGNLKERDHLGDRSVDGRVILIIMDAIPLYFNIEVHVVTSITQQKLLKIPPIFYLMRDDMFRLCLQPSSGQLVVRSTYR